MGKINIKDLVKLIFSCVIILYLAVVLAYLMVSVIIFKLVCFILIGRKLSLKFSEEVLLVA